MCCFVYAFIVLFWRLSLASDMFEALCSVYIFTMLVIGLSLTICRMMFALHMASHAIYAYLRIVTRSGLKSTDVVFSSTWNEIREHHQWMDEKICACYLLLHYLVNEFRKILLNFDHNVLFCATQMNEKTMYPTFY